MMSIKVLLTDFTNNRFWGKTKKSSMTRQTLASRVKLAEMPVGSLGPCWRNMPTKSTQRDGLQLESWLIGWLVEVNGARTRKRTGNRVLSIQVKCHQRKWWFRIFRGVHILGYMNCKTCAEIYSDMLFCYKTEFKLSIVDSQRCWNRIHHRFVLDIKGSTTSWRKFKVAFKKGKSGPLLGRM